MRGVARSTAELLRIADILNEKGAGLQSLDEPWADTTTPAGKMIMTVFGGIAEFERTLSRSSAWGSLWQAWKTQTRSEKPG